VADTYGVKTDKEFVNALEDNIRERGAMDKLISDCARAETCARIKDILRTLVISDWQSEPYHEAIPYAAPITLPTSPKFPVGTGVGIFRNFQPCRKTHPYT
jgi:hypothetical protein